MKQILLDTHTWIWSFADDKQLSNAARDAIEKADGVFVSPISFFEIGQRVRIGKWPEMEPYVAKLGDILKEQGGLAASFSPDICLHASMRDWAHHDPFDRLIASTAELLEMTLISKDSAFTELGSVRCVW